MRPPRKPDIQSRIAVPRTTFTQGGEDLGESPTAAGRLSRCSGRKRRHPDGIWPSHAITAEGPAALPDLRSPRTGSAGHHRALGQHHRGVRRHAVRIPNVRDHARLACEDSQHIMAELPQPCGAARRAAEAAVRLDVQPARARRASPRGRGEHLQSPQRPSVREDTSILRAQGPVLCLC